MEFSPYDLADELEASLKNDLLAHWFPACIDPTGGFHQNFAADWTLLPDRERSVVFQSRMTWVAAVMDMPGVANHGLDFLANNLLDPNTGGFRWDTGSHREIFHAYGVSFAIYALTAVTNHTALDIAKRAFHYLESHHYDGRFGGYFEVETPSNARDMIGTPPGQKSQNTQLHLLEAFTDLYRLWPDPRLRDRLAELLSIFVNRFYVAPGWLHTHVEFDWTPIPGRISHGHDIEAAHLILAAAEALGLADDPEVTLVARSLVDYALQTGWDTVDSGFYNEGNPDGAVTDPTKVWWVQAEGLLALATFYQLTGESRYSAALLHQWDWIKRHQIDAERGGWIEHIPGPLNDRKGHAWKGAYHDGRALLCTARILRQL